LAATPAALDKVRSTAAWAKDLDTKLVPANRAITRAPVPTAATAVAPMAATAATEEAKLNGVETTAINTRNGDWGKGRIPTGGDSMTGNVRKR